MARYTDDSKERVRDAVDMVDLVGARTELRRAGRRPLHGAAARSTTSARRRSAIDPAEKLYHCFGCGVGGDAFKFVQETEGVDFAGALELLADRYGVDARASRTRIRAAAERRARARAAARAARAHGGLLRALPVGVRRGRARRASTSPSAGSTRRRCASSASATRRARGTSVLHRLAARGLHRRASSSTPGWRRARGKRRAQLYDRFRRRIMFPLCDQRGRVLGFGARAMGADQQPKYLNSSDGEVFHKGRHLFGADIARARGGEGRRGDRRRGLHRRASRCTRPGCATPSG